MIMEPEHKIFRASIKKFTDRELCFQAYETATSLNEEKPILAELLRELCARLNRKKK